MLNKLVGLWLICVCLAFSVERAPADGFGPWGFFQTSNVTRTPSVIPTIVPGTITPRSQTPLDPNVSQDGPRCLDSTWGACDGTQHCIAPTVGTPLESCQSPLQLFISSADATASTGNGTTAVIHYHSATNFAYAVGQPLMIQGATQANWNTPDIQLNSTWTYNNTDALCSSGPSIQFGYATLSAAPFNVGSVVYFNGLTGPNGGFGSGGKGFGWGPIGTTTYQVNPNAHHTIVAATTSTAKFCVTNEPQATSTISNAGTGGPGGAVQVTNLPFVATSGTATGMSGTLVCGGGFSSTNLFVTNWGNNQAKLNDTFTFDSSLAPFGNVAYCAGFQGTVTQPTLVASGDGIYGHSVQPWFVSASSCTAGACTVTFANPNTCASACVSATATQIVAGQFSDDILAWNYGENVPMKTFVSGDNVLICAVAAHISPQQAVWFEADGGAFVKSSTPMSDPWGTGGPWVVDGVGTISQPIGPANNVYCAQAAASTFHGDGQHEIRAIACAQAGYCTQLSSVKAIDGTAASSVFKANSHSMKDFYYQGITKSFDAKFPNYNFAYQSLAYAAQTGIPLTLGTMTSNGSVITVPWSTGTPIFPPQVGQTIGLSGVTTTNSCTVTGGTAALPFLTLNLTGTCNFPTGSLINVSGISNTGSTWNGNNIIVTTGGVCAAGACTITYPALSTGAWSSGGTVKADFNEVCVVQSSTAGSLTCPTLTASGTTGTGGTWVASGNTMCVIGGNGDNPPPYTQFDTTQFPFGSQLTPDTVQIEALSLSPLTCSPGAGSTGCQKDLITHTTPCGIVPTGTETLWSWDRNAGMSQGQGGVAKTMVASYFFYTNVGGTIQSRRAYVNSWNPSSVTSGGCNNASTFAAGSSLSTPAFAGTPCSTIALAQDSLAPSMNNRANLGGALQTLAQLTVGSTQCLVFENIANVGATSLYAGEPIDFQEGYDTNSGTDANTGVAMPEFSQYAQYWIVGVGTAATGNVNGITLSNRPGGPCINETPSLITTGTTSQAILLGDVSFDEILLQCDTTIAVPCSTSHPETYPLNATIPSTGLPSAAIGGWFGIDPDRASGATAYNVSLLPGGGGLFNNSGDLGGRIRQGVSNIDKPIPFNSVVTVGPTPPTTPLTGGSLATCPAPNAAHQCETLTFVPVVDGLNQPNGAQFQVPTAGGSPGQSLWVTVTASSGNWGCGTAIATPCLGGAGVAQGIISSTTASVTFINDAATGTIDQFAAVLLTSGTAGVTNGTYTNVPLTGGTGSGALATIVVTGTSVKSVFSFTLTSQGAGGYTTGDILSALPANIGGVTGFSAKVNKGFITAVNLIVEAAAHTFAPQCATTSNAPINTSGFTYCFENDTTTGQMLGTNQYSQGIFFTPFGANGNTINPATIDDSNCVQNPSGNFANTTYLNHVDPSSVTGATHDIVYLTTASGSSNLTGATYAQNQCNTKFVISNNSFVWPIGEFDLWLDSFELAGPYWRSPKTGGANPLASVYATNVLHYETLTGFSETSYTWGSQELYGADCISTAEVNITVACTTNQTRIPIAQGGIMKSDGQPFQWITKGWDAAGTVTTCGGQNCLADAAHTDQGTATLSVGFAPGALTADFSLFWQAFVSCNVVSGATIGSSPGLVENLVVAANNAATTHAPSEGSITMAAPVSGQCLIPTGTPGPGFPALSPYDSDHTDFSFWHYAGDPGIPTSTITSASAWMHWKDFIGRNVTCFCGANEGFLTQGANYVNIAEEDGFMEIQNGPYASVISTIDSVSINGGQNIDNFIIRNSTVTGLTRATQATAITDLYLISVNGGTNTRFPAASIDWMNQGFSGGSGSALSSFAGAGTTGGGWAANAAISPTSARFTDPTTGLSIGPAQDPWAATLRAEPWYGVGTTLGDSGLGSY